MTTTMSILGEYVRSNMRAFFADADGASMLQTGPTEFLFGKTVEVFGETYEYGARFKGSFVYAPGSGQLIGGVVTSIEFTTILNPDTPQAIVRTDGLAANYVFYALLDGVDDFLEQLGPLAYSGKPDAYEGADVFEAWRFDDTLFGYTGDDTLSGGAGDDQIEGGVDNDRLDGGSGDDALNGESGNDHLAGGDGKDRLFGGEGNDLLDGGKGADAMMGGAGDDTYVLVDKGDVVDESAPGSDGFDTVQTAASLSLSDKRIKGDVEAIQLIGDKKIDATGDGAANRLTGNDKANVLSGLNAADTLIGGGGGDTLIGGKGPDSLDGGEGFDFASYATAAKPVQVDLLAGVGERGDAIGDQFASIEGLIGSRHGDALRGDDGDNVIIGGGGADRLTGGRGKDRFAYETASDSPNRADRRDAILDFERGIDRLDLRQIDAQPGQKGDQKLDFIGSDKFSGDEGELRAVSKAGGVLLSADLDGDGQAEFSIFLDLVSKLTKDDIML